MRARKDLLLTDIEVERLTTISRYTLRNWRSQGEGPPYLRIKSGPGKKSGKVLYEAGTVLAWLKAWEVKGRQ